jgi:hypothetical protein
MAIYNEIYNTLQVSTPTNNDLARLIYGKSTYNTRGSVRKHIAQVRRRFKVSVVADEYGRYHTTVPQYTYEDNQWNYAGKLGRPRAFAA